MYFYPVVTMVLLAIAILVASLMPVTQLIRLLPSRVLKHNWYAMTVLIVVFIFCYLGYTYFFWDRDAQYSDLIAPFAFFIGASFVWMTARLSFQTTVDLQRINTLEQENIEDPLTGVFNRRYMDRRLPGEVVRSRRYGQDLSVFMFDIDHFKRINDEYGHQSGDTILVALGQLALGDVRQSDIVSRYGGEEFLVILPSTTLQEAAFAAERLRDKVEAYPFRVSEDGEMEESVSVTISLGVASLSESMHSGEDLVRAVDEALYRAKEEGRNRVCLAESA